jgi:Ca2+-transporting ATPase
MGFMALAMSAATLGYFIWKLKTGMPFDQVRAGTFTLLVVCQWFNSLNCLSERNSAFCAKTLENYWLWGGLMLANLLQVAVIFFKPLQSLFHTAAIPWSEILWIGAAGSLVLWTEELRKWIARRGGKAPRHTQLNHDRTHFF